MKFLKQFFVSVILLALCRVAVSEPGVGVSETHFCLLAKAEVKCYDSKGEVDFPSNRFKYAFGVYGGGNNQCVRDYNGLHCWNWENKNLVDYPELSNIEQLQVSKGYVCGAKSGEWRCLLAPQSPLSTVPLLPKVNSLHVLDSWICTHRSLSELYKEDQLVVECYHPERSPSDPLKFTWAFPEYSYEVGFTARNNTLALVLGLDGDRHKSEWLTVVVSRWKLPDTAFDLASDVSGVIWRKFDHYRQNDVEIEHHNFTPLDSRALYLLEDNELFLLGRNERFKEKTIQVTDRAAGKTWEKYVFSDEIKAGFLQLNKEFNQLKHRIEEPPSEFYYPDNESAYRAKLNPRLNGVPSFEEGFNEIVDWQTESDFPLFINERFVCLGNSLGLSCGEPGVGEEYFKGLNSFIVSEVPDFKWVTSLNSNFEGWDDYQHRGHWLSEYRMQLERLPSEKASFATSILKEIERKYWPATFIVREILLPIFETTNTEYHREIAWKEGMKLSSMKQQIQIPLPLNAELVDLLKIARSKLGTEEEIKREAWRRLVLERINLYTHEEGNP